MLRIDVITITFCSIGTAVDETRMANKQQQTSAREWFTAGEAAQYLKVGRRTILLWTRQGKVKGFALSGTKRRLWRYRPADLDAALR